VYNRTLAISFLSVLFHRAGLRADSLIGGTVSRNALRILTLLMFALPGTLFAQDNSLAALLPNAFAQGATMQPDSSGSGADHQTHFFAALGDQGQAAFALNKLMVLQLDTFPLPTSSGAFVATFDPQTHLFKPVSKSFGPGYAERALTNGRGHFQFGMNYQQVSFSSFEGFNLKGGSNNITYALQHNDCCPPVNNPPAPGNPTFEDDTITIQPTIDISSNTTSPYFSYGVNDRWDVGVVVPVVHVSLSTTVNATLYRLGEACPQAGTPAIIHTWDGTCNPNKAPVQMSGNATGIGDVDIRTKYRFLDGAQGGLAVGLDVRVPSGNKDQLLGTGATRAKLMAIWSGEFSRFSPHANLGYTYSHGDLSSATTQLPALNPATQPTNPATGSQISLASAQSLGGSLKVPNELNYTAGADVVVHPLLTVWADVIGRTVFNVERFDALPTTYSGSLGSINVNNFQSSGLGNLNLVLGAVGAKFNIPHTQLLLTGNVVFPLTQSGLRPNVTPVIGLDYSFGK
jgi:hypothetical protein